MSDWVFPNALAESVRRTAFLRGQNANRIEIRDFADRWPAFQRVDPEEGCPSTAGVKKHERPIVKQGERLFVDPFCTTCGLLVRT